MSAAFGGIWKKFLDLLPSDPRYTATVAAIKPRGQFVVNKSGTLVDVIGEGSYTVGMKVFVKGNKIESEAPNLPSYTVDV